MNLFAGCIEMLITNLKLFLKILLLDRIRSNLIPKTADLVRTGYFGSFLEDNSTCVSFEKS